MIIRNSLKQIMRTWVRTGLFVLLLTLAVLLTALGGNLWLKSSVNMKKLQESFTTIGTVEQKKSSVEQLKDWDAERKEYQFFSRPQYGTPIPVSVLDFEGAEYMHEPEKRPFYEAHLPGYKIWSNTDSYASIWVPPVIVEVTPLEDCIPDHPVELSIDKVVYSYTPLNGSSLMFCDHYNETPDKLFAGKKYIMCLVGAPAHADRMGSDEYRPGWSLKGVQYNEEGERLPSKTPDTFYEEITDSFYEEGGGWETWETLMRIIERAFETVPVTPTNSTELLMSFYNGASYIQEGSDISETQYTQGDKVCLIEKDFAADNDLSIGDSMNLSLFAANYRFSPGYLTSYFSTKLNAEGKMYPVFSDHDYEIVGIYANAPGGALAPAYRRGNAEIIIPWKSVEESDADNIVASGPMMGYTTSFQIPNGTIEEFMELWNKQGIDGLNITFYDKGYSKLKSGLDQIQFTARILLAAGIILAILILTFFCHLFISRQRRRIAIERSLGVTMRQCKASLMAGIMTIAVIGSIIGCSLGYVLSDKVEEAAQDRDFYNIAYSSGVLKVQENEDGNNVELSEDGDWVLLVAGLGIIVMAYAIALVDVNRNLSQEPLELLGGRDE